MNDTASKPTSPAASLPYADRRSLSEAWYSALHLASDGPPAAGAPERRAPVAAAGAATRPATCAERSAPRVNPRAMQPGGSQRAAHAAGEPVSAHRAALRKLPDAKRLRPAAIRYAPFRTSLTLGQEGRRVQLLLRREGGTLHVAALCNAQVAATVRRALACADAHFRLRGESVRSTVHVIGSGGIAL